MGSLPSTWNRAGLTAENDVSVRDSGGAIATIVVTVVAASAVAPFWWRLLADRVPEVQGPGQDASTGHAVTDRGWYNDAVNNARGLYFWDPWDSTYHSTSLGAAWTFNSQAGRQQVW